MKKNYFSSPKDEKNGNKLTYILNVNKNVNGSTIFFFILLDGERLTSKKIKR